MRSSLYSIDTNPAKAIPKQRFKRDQVHKAFLVRLSAMGLNNNSFLHFNW
jgi:hypothetical protein